MKRMIWGASSQPAPEHELRRAQSEKTAADAAAGAAKARAVAGQGSNFNDSTETTSDRGQAMRNHATSRTVTAKTAPRRSLAATARALAAALMAGTSALALGYSAAMADQTIAPTWNGSNYTTNTYTLSDGSTSNYTGAFSLAPSSSPSSQRSYYDWQQYDILNGTSYLTGLPDLATIFYLSTGSQTKTIIYTDPISGLQRSYNVFDSSNLSIYSATSAGGLTGYGSAASSNIYTDLRLATVSNGTLNVDVQSAHLGNTGSSLAYGPSQIGGKDTALVYATGTGNAVWQHDASVLFMYGIAASTADASPRPLNVTGTVYAGTFTAYDGSTKTVSSNAEFKAYNDWLISEIQAGRLATTQYNAQFMKAYVQTTYTGTFDPLGGGSVSPTDPLFDPVIKQVVMQADGAGANASIAAGVNMWINGGSANTTTPNTPTAVLYATNGGTVTNNGLISSAGSSQFPAGIWVESGGTGINNGVSTVGYRTTLAEGATASGKTPLAGGGSRVYDTGSRFINNGIINVSNVNAYSNTGLYVYTGAAAINHGAINVGVVNSTYDTPAFGVRLDGTGGNSTFTNASDGVIYIGREASADLAAAPIDRGGADTFSQAGGYGVYAQAGATGTNLGTIIIGGRAANSTAMYGNGANTAVINSGIINLNGANTDSPGTNYGMRLASTTGASLNDGTINLNGINGIGIYATGASKITSSGTININSASDPVTGLYNYGIWTETSGANPVILSGTINLYGDGAIGVHARNTGKVQVTGAGAVVFNSGENQIGYFVYGAGSSITNTGTGAQDVSTKGSVLFRMEDGANFTGSAAATSTLTASGESSTAIVMTGRASATAVSAFNSGGMTINVSGTNATGVLVEGGAQGRITSAAVINLTGDGAVAGIADGQKHALNGAVSGTPIAGAWVQGSTANAGAGASFGTGTILVAGANLNSALNNVTGYIARNQAELNNSGNLVFTGAHTTGIRVEEGSVGGNSGAITIQDGSVGLIAASTSAVTTLNNTGNITLKGGSDADRTKGISATGSAVTVNMSAGTIDMQGQGAIGVQALAGAKVNLTGTASVAFAAEATGVTNQIAFLVSGAGSTITTATSGGSLVASGKNSTLIRLENGATQSGVLTMGASGTGSRGIWATGDGTTVTALSGSTFTVSGNQAEAVQVDGGAHVTLNSGVIVNLTGTNTIVGTVDGNEYDLAGAIIGTNKDSQLISAATLNSTTAGATGFIAQNAGTLTNSGAITFSGTGSQAVKVLNGNFVNTANVTANGTAVYVEGANSTVQNNGGAILATDGRAAVELGAGASLNLVGSGVNTVEGRGTAHAVLVGTGATGLNVTGAHLIVNAAGATGNGIENAAEISGIQLNNTVIDVMGGKGVRTAASLAATNSGTINVAGSGIGLAFETATGTAMGNNVDLSGSAGLTVAVTGANGTGISVKHTGGGDLNNAANVTVAAGGGSAVKLAGVSTFENAGSLTSSASAIVVDLGNATSVVNTGTIQAASATAAAMTFDAQNSSFTNSGTVVGVIDLGAGVNTALLNAGSSTSSVVGGAGQDTVTVKGNAAFGKLDGGTGASDRLIFDAATHTLSATSDIDHFEFMDLKNGSVITTADAIKMTDTAGGAGTVFIETGSTLAIAAPSSAYTFNHALTGAGTLTATMASGTTQFAFASTTGSAFTGLVELGAGAFTLSGVNTTALTNATLQLDSGNTTTVGTGAQTIKNLKVNGGTMVFDAQVPADLVSPANIVTTGNLDISGTGTVRITVPAGGFDNTQPLPNTSAPLLAQDDATAMTRLIQSTGTVTGTGGALVLQDQNGVVISNGKVLDITQNSTTVAKGTYDYRLMSTGTSGVSDGLYVGYGLTQVELIGTGTDALVLAPATGATGLATDLSAKLTGTGDLAIGAGAGKTVSLSNTLNDYSGVTTVSTGTLRLDANSALGTTAQLAIATGAAADINGKTQAIGTLAGATGSSLNVNGGSLTIANGGTSNGTLTGAGTMTLAGGSLAVNGANTGLTANVSIATPATATLTNVAGLGTSGALTDNGTLVLDGATGTFSKTVAGAGAVNLANAADVTLSGTNTFTGSWNTAAGTRLTVSEAANLGASSAVVNNAGTFDVNTATNWTLANAVTGAGIFVKDGTGTLTIARANTMTGPANVNGGMLTLTDTEGVGTGLVTVNTAAGSTTTGLNLAFATNQTFDNQIAGAGTTSVTGAGLATITGANSAYTGTWQITGKAAVDGASTTSTQNLGTGTVNIVAGGSLTAATTGAFTFANKLTGAGTLNASNNGGAFAFGPAATVGTAFTGAVNLANNTFALSGDNTSALTNATAVLGTGNVTTVGTGRQAIGGLAFAGGTAIFDATAPADKLANSWIDTGTLDMTGASGTVKISVPASGFDNSQPLPTTALSLMEQDDANVLLQLIKAGSVVNAGGAASLTLQDQNGNVIGAATSVGIQQGGVTVANGTYDYGLTAGANSDGLYVNYGLKELELIGTGTNALVLAPSSGASGAAAALSAKVTGTGDLVITGAGAAGNTVTLSNSGNDYSGQTAIAGGTVKMAADNVFGRTSNLLVNSGATVDTAGYSQTTGALNTGVGAQVVIGTGSTLIIDGARANGAVSLVEAGTLAGAGALTIDPSVVSVNGAQAGFTGLITVQGGSMLALNTAEAFDNARSIELASAGDTLTFGSLAAANPAWTGVANGTSAANIAGLGTVQVIDGSDVTLMGDNTSFAGTFAIDPASALRVSQPQHTGTAGVVADGTFEVKSDGYWAFTNMVTGTGTVLKSGAGILAVNQELLGFTGLTDVQQGVFVVGEGNIGALVGGAARVAQGAVLSGTGTVLGAVENNGVIAALNAVSGYEAAPASNLSVGALTNSGVIMLAGGSVGNTLTVYGGMTGNNGVVVMSTVLGGDSSQTDRLILSGGATSGHTALMVLNRGGAGAQTGTGIEVVRATNGATTTADAFALDPASTGYRASGAGALVIGAYDYSLVRGGNGGNADSWYLTSVDPSSGTGAKVLRPEAGIYLAHAQVARTMFLTTLHDREGYVQLGSGAGSQQYAGWGRVSGRYDSMSVAGNALNADTGMVTAQLGVDLFKAESPHYGTFYAGVMGGWGHAETDAKSRHGAFAKASGSVDGYAVGAYGTWYQKDRGLGGAYVDGWTQYSWFNNEVRGGGLPKEKYDSHAFTASLEAGYAVLLADSGHAKVFIEPQAQLAYISVSADRHVERNGTAVRYRDGSGIVARLGARFYGVVMAENGTVWRPFLEANYWYNQKGGKLYMDNDLVPSGAPRSFGEVKLGMSGDLSQNWQVWGAAVTRFGGHNYTSVGGQLGVKYTW